MKNQFKKMVFILITFLAAITLASPIVDAKISTSTDAAHLTEARKLITSKHYQSGYLKFRSMAKRGCPFSQCILGIMHQKGLGVEKNSGQALYWFEKSAQQGFADASK